MCSEMHNIKDAIYENKRKMEAMCEDYQIQVCICFQKLYIFIVYLERFIKEMCHKGMVFFSPYYREAVQRPISCKGH